MSTYKEKLDSWYAKNTFMPRHQPAKSPQLTEEEVEEWKLKNAGNFIACPKSGTSLLRSNCGKLLMCYQQGTCYHVDYTNFDKNLQRKAYDFNE
jgi:hypothetical protein